VKEGTFWRESAILVSAVGGVLITAAAIALCAPWFGLVDLREVVITGNHQAATADLVSLSGLQRGQSLLAMSLRRASANLLRHPWIKNVLLKRRLPHTLVIQVQERGGGVGAVLLEEAIADLIDALRRGVLASLGTQLIDLTNPGSVELETGGGLRVLLGDMNEVLLRLDSLAALCRSLDVEDYEVIDLRFGGEATLVPR